MLRKTVVLASLCLVAWAVRAEPPVAEAPGAVPAQEIGATTESLLSLQRSGLAAGQPQLVTGEVASRSYQRYLDSFKQPMTTGQAQDALQLPSAATAKR